MTPALQDAIAAAVRAERAATEALLASLIAVPSVRGEPTTIDAAVRAALGGSGAAVTAVMPDPAALPDDPEWSPPPWEARPVSLLARWGAQPRTVLFAHLDTEPADPAGWGSDPWSARVAGGRMTGLGAADDKAGVAAMIAAVRVLARLGVAPDGLALAFVHAKGGGSLGTLPVWRALGPADRALYLHPAETGRGLADLKRGSRGLVAVRVAVAGRAPEPVEERTPVSADPAAGVNALERAAWVIEQGRAWAAAAPGRQVAVTDLRVADAQPWRVPDAAELELSIWFSEGTIASTVSSLRAWLEARDPAGPDVAPLRVAAAGLRANPAAVPDGAFLASVADAVQAVTGRPPTPYGHHAASDIRFPVRLHDTPAAGLGPTGGGFYGPGEWVDLASLHQAVEIVARLLVTWGATGAARVDPDQPSSR